MLNSAIRDRAFFSLGQTKHLELCQKPVFLDFDYEVVQVERFTDAVHGFSGFGRTRSREWFAQTYLSTVRKPGPLAPWEPGPDERRSDPWARSSPVRKLKFPTRWVDGGGVVTFPKWTEYVPLVWFSHPAGDSRNRTFNWEKIIDQFPDLANGWSKEDMQAIEVFLRGTPIILGGLLRLLPTAAEHLEVASPVRSVEMLRSQADGHVAAGRLPLLKDTTRRAILDRAREYEIRQFGRVLGQTTASAKGDGQRGLFD